MYEALQQLARAQLCEKEEERKKENAKILILHLPYISVSKGMKQRIHINVTKDLFSFFQIYLDRGVFFYLVPSVKVLSMELVPPNREKCLAGAEMGWTGRQTHLIAHQLISNSMVP